MSRDADSQSGMAGYGDILALGTDHPGVDVEGRADKASRLVNRTTFAICNVRQV